MYKIEALICPEMQNEFYKFSENISEYNFQEFFLLKEGITGRFLPFISFFS